MPHRADIGNRYFAATQNFPPRHPGRWASWGCVMTSIEEIVNAAIEAQARINPEFAEFAQFVREETAWRLEDPVGYATACVADARAATPEPRSVSHWGMVG